MRKIAIFAEGQSELIFIRGFLLEWFEYQIKLECRNLLKGDDLRQAGHNFFNPSATLHILIINVGMDENVISRILEREQELYNSGFEIIIGLRDMYSEKYRKEIKTQIVNTELSEKFRHNIAKTIEKRAKRPDLIKFCFAIMELEAWWIGIPSLWKDVDSELKLQNESCFSNPESVFHPASFIDQLFQSQQSKYTKKKGEVESIVGRISRDDYAELLDSQRCPSFCEFFQHLQSQ